MNMDKKVEKLLKERQELIFKVSLELFKLQRGDYNEKIRAVAKKS